jgi:SAM-dependent methyltransferase
MPDPGRIVRMASAFQESCLLFAASDLGIFRELAKAGKADTAHLARALGLNERGARLILDGCAAIGLLHKESGLYRNSPEAEAFLVPGHPGDLSGALRYNRDVYPAWGRVAQLARTGVPVEKPELHLGEDTARTRTFVLANHGKALAMLPAVMPLLDITGRRQLLDVGGGPGTFSAAIARANTGIQCTVLELAAVAAIAAELIEQEGQSGRVRLLEGDYHTTPFPPGNDVVLLFGMLHQEPAETIREILARAYCAMAPGGIVYVLDMMTDESHVNPPFSTMFGVNMALTKEHGWVFSETELCGWMTDAGFTDFRCRPLPPPMPHWLAAARKP